MSEVTRTAARLRIQADFLDEHQALLDAVSYDTAITAWREAHPDRGSFGYPVEENGDEPLVYATYYASHEVAISVYGSDADAKELTRRIRRAIGGQWDKPGAKDTSSRFKLTQRLSEEPRTNVTISVERTAVCTPVTELQEVTIPAKAAVEAVEEHTEMKEVVVDYDCGNLLVDPPALSFVQ